MMPFTHPEHRETPFTPKFLYFMLHLTQFFPPPNQNFD
jgi:hypothetical protein